MVLVFIFCQCFTIVADVYELICTIFPPVNVESTFCRSNEHIENFIDVAHFMIAVNSSVNFIFYMVNIKEFRESFITVSQALQVNEKKSDVILLSLDVFIFNMICNKSILLYFCSRLFAIVSLTNVGEITKTNQVILLESLYP